GRRRRDADAAGAGIDSVDDNARRGSRRADAAAAPSVVHRAWHRVGLGGRRVEAARDRMDPLMYQPEQPTAAEPETDVALFQTFNPTVAGKLVVMPTIAPAAVEQYRRLAASLHHAKLERETRVLMV